MLTIFTPTYNRAHTLPRTYKSLLRQTQKNFEWIVIDDGSTDNTKELVNQWEEDHIITIRYIEKENGGLYTGYNVAYQHARGELTICIDSDDYMPDDAVEKITKTWEEKGGEAYAGILGLDYLLDGTAIGGPFPEDMKEVFFYEMNAQRSRSGDSKLVLRTDLVRKYCPMIGFPGEKNFNPVYIAWQVCDELPLLVLNENLCYVDYQYQPGGDSMSAGIWKQYVNSPRSFQKQRLLEMTLKHNCLSNLFRVAIHYVAESLLAKDFAWLRHSPRKTITLLSAPLGIALYCLILYKNR